jgi:hypothetical protein
MVGQNQRLPHYEGTDFKRLEHYSIKNQIMSAIPTSAKGTLEQMLNGQWEKIPFYDFDRKDDLINIAESYGLTELVERFNKTYHL